MQCPPPPANIGVPLTSFCGAYTTTGCHYQVQNQDDISFEIRPGSPLNQRLRWQGGFYYPNIDREVGVATLLDNAPVATVLYGSNLVCRTPGRRLDLHTVYAV